MHKEPDAKPRAMRRKPVPVDLGLQGGGAHGAFTWGVLDRLLDEPWLTFEGISGTSAGAMNAAVMASGYVHGGPEGAKAALATFWKSMSDAARFSPIQRGPFEMLTGKWTLENSPMYLATEMMSRIFSPYELNPLGAHPLRGILAETVDFDCLASAPIKLFITATNVATGAGRVFRHYLDTEAGDLFMALGRYNGSRGKTEYPNLVFGARRQWDIKV